MRLSGPKTLQAFAGLAIVLLGSLVLVGWVLREPALVRFRPDWVAMVANTAACFVALGAALLLTSDSSTAVRLRRTLGIAVSLLALGVLIEGLFRLDLGLDWPRIHRWLDDSNQWPGRMAPNTSLGFLLAGLVTAFGDYVTSQRRAVLLQVATVLVLLLGLTGWVGYSLQLELLFSGLHATRMALPTAVAMTVLGVALTARLMGAPWNADRRFFREDERILFAGGAFLAIVALTTAVTGFASQQQTLDRVLSDTLPIALDSRIELFEAEVDQAVAKAVTTAARPRVLWLIRQLRSNPDDPAARAELEQIGQATLQTGVDVLAIRDAAGVEVLRLGQFSPASPRSVVLSQPVATTLFWNDGYRLGVTKSMREGRALLGTLRMEVPLPLMQKQMLEDPGLGSTGEVNLCLRRAAELHCFPQHRQRDLYVAARRSSNGKPTPMSLAVDGASGIFKGLDYRGINVVAAYAPVGAPGLGIVVKQSSADLLAPIKAQLLWSVPLVLLLVAAGVVLLRLQVRPMAAQLVRSEQEAIDREARIRAVVENVGDGIIVIDAAGTIEAFNAAAAEIFGYAPAEVIGSNIQRLMPAAQRPAHEAGLQRFLHSGAPRVIGRKGLQLPALRQDGTVFPIELSVSHLQRGGAHRFIGVVRDISERMRNEAAVFAERERLRVTLSSIGDGVITTDVHGNVTYLNPVAESMTGWALDEALGKALPEVFHVVHELTGAPALNPVEVVLRDDVSAALEEHTTLLQRGGGRFAIEDSAAPIRDLQGEVIGVVLVFHDVSQARKMAREMTFQATHDALTGLINRREFEHRLGQAIESGRVEARSHTMLYLDLDQFKIVNDSCGHAAGDELLKQLTAMLLDKLRRSDTLARLGGDEFAVLLEGCPLEPALRIADGLRQAVREFQYSCQDKIFPVGVSIGVVSFSNGGITLDEVLQMADAACYAAKDEGRNRVHVFAHEDAQLTLRHGEMGWIGRIQKALLENRFLLHSQKILSLGVDAPDESHYEVLLRLRDEEGGLVPPMAFIPAAERYGLMPALDRWVIATALADLARRSAGGERVGTCAINLSATSVNDPEFAGFVAQELDRLGAHGVSPDRVCFEITETAVISNLAHAATLIRELTARGCRFALDDFGSGMSSFGYLKNLPVTYLKIDGGFVRDMLSDPIDRAMVESINNIGHVMGKQTIAEYVEDDATLAALRAMGVDFAQGYGVAKPQTL